MAGTRATGWWTRGRATLASVLTIAVAVGVPVSFAILHEGFPVTDVELTTKDVWVTNGETLQAGRLNRQIEELDAGVAAATPAVDVVQNGRDVFLYDRTVGSLERVDPAFTRLIERVDLPGNPAVALGGTTIAVLGQDDGELWVIDDAGPLELDLGTDPAVELGQGAKIAVSTSGIVFATSPTDGLLYEIDGAGAKPASRELDYSAEHQLTAVGDEPVILDTERNAVVFGDGSTTALGSSTGLRIQQPGATSDDVIVATGDALLRVPLDGGELASTPAEVATPVVDPSQVSAPVWLDGCAHGAWAGAQQYLLSCDGHSAKPSPIPDATQGSTLEFRVNKNVIALNDLTTGNVWLVDSNMKLVSNWQLTTPPVEDENLEGEEKSATQSFEDTLAERTDQNRPPTARDDQFGLRAGRTTILPVIENDTDPDGDVLTVVTFDPVDPGTGILDSIDGGRALQFTPAAGATSASFGYTIDDGRGGQATAFATVRVVPETENNPPVENRTTTVSVEANGSVSYNVLTDWRDPDGDDLTLLSAAPVGGDTVRFTPDGFVTFQSVSTEVGDKEVRLVVSDGTAQAAGTFVVTVEPAGTLGPVGTPDYAEAFTGESVLVSPTDNDVSPTGGLLTLVGADEAPSGVTITPDLERKTLGLSAESAGTYYLTYEVAAGTATSKGLIRFDVVDPPAEQLPPVAVKDTAYLRAGEPSTVRVLDNDVSPNGLVLAVQSIDTSNTDGALSVELLNNTVIRVTSSNALTAQTQFTYTVSDGVQTAVAGVTVVPIPPIADRQPPVALDDRAKVRAGDFASVDVLENDFHPDNAEMFLAPALDDVSGAGDGLAFVGNGQVRYQAGQTPGEYSVVYRVTDQYGESAAARVTFVVVPDDLATNQPPLPEPQVARVFSGGSVPITIPLDGMDPDGDSVVVTAIATQPAKGVLSKVTESGFTYTSNPTDAGTDLIEYEVQDIYGAKAIGQVRIGVIPRPAVGSPPNAVDDAVDVKPGRTASVPVLANDSDPAGYKLRVTKLPEVDDGITAEIVDNTVVVVAPEVEETYSLRYQIDNGHGGVDTAFLQVNVTPDAKPVYPTAIDYYVPLDDVVGNDYVDVDLSPLVSNPGGREDGLVVSVEGPFASAGVVDQAAQTIRVTPQKARVAIAYRVTNPDDQLTATAFIIVPPEVSASYSPPPYLDPDLPEQIVEMNGEKSWNLDELLIVPSGRPAIITAASTVESSNSDGVSSYVDEDTLHFAPAKDYRGPATIRFEVTDGKDAADINGNKATILFAFSVGDPDFTDAPPTFTRQDITIEAGEDRTVVDLRASTSHPNPSLIPQMTYEGLAGATDKVHAELGDGILTVWADRGVQPGAKTALTFTVKYDEFEVAGTVGVTTVSSTKPLAQAREDAAKGQRGVVQPALNVIENDYNPFASTNEPLTLIDARIDNAGESEATISSQSPDGSITVQPGPNFIGTISVVYTIGDVTADPARQVQGRYLLTVRDVPSKIAAPVATTGDRQASVAFKTPATNGEPITSYTVSWSPPDGTGGGSVSLPPTAAGYTATGLTNGTDYRFRVTATNVMGTSEISDQSNAVRPLGQATPPSSLTLSASADGRGVLSMAWSGAGPNGGQITGYEWRVTPGGFTGTTVSPSASQAVTVGQSYTFQVRALATGGDSEWSAVSTPVVPRYGAPTALQINAPGAAQSGNYRVTGSWGDAPANGIAAGDVPYQWRVVGPGGPPSGNRNGTGTFDFTGNESSDYRLEVRAGTAGALSDWVVSRTVTTPSAPPPPDPPDTEWSAQENTGGTCPEQLNGNHFYDGNPATCTSPHGFANGSLTVYCFKQWGGNPWYLFSGDGYSKGEGWYVKGTTISINSNADGPKGC